MSRRGWQSLKFTYTFEYSNFLGQTRPKKSYMHHDYTSQNFLIGSDMKNQGIHVVKMICAWYTSKMLRKIQR